MLNRRIAAVLTQVTETVTTRINDAALPATGQVLEWRDRIQIGDYALEYR
jgi:hypothetical protein